MTEERPGAISTSSKALPDAVKLEVSIVSGARRPDSEGGDEPGLPLVDELALLLLLEERSDLLA